MIANYYTLFHLAADIDREFSGQAVDEMFTQHRSQLVISFKGLSAAVLIGCEPADNYLYIRRAFSRAKRNSAGIFPELSGAIIDRVSIHPSDREVQFFFRNRNVLRAQLFGSRANIYLEDGSGTIVDTFLKKPNSENIGAETIARKASPLEFIDALNTDEVLETVLKKMLPLFGGVLVRELVTRAGLNAGHSANSLLDTEKSRLAETANRLKAELAAQPAPRIYFNEDVPVRFSILPLQHLREHRTQVFESVSEAIHVYRSTVFQQKELLRQKAEILTALERGYHHAEKTLRKISEEKESEGRAEQYELFGKLIIANIHRIEKGETLTVAEDVVHGTDSLVEIPLDPFLTPAKNAQRYFDKAEKSHRAREEQRTRAAILSVQAADFSRLIEGLEEVVTLDELHRFTKEHVQSLAALGFKTAHAGEVIKQSPPPFRVFTVAGGFQVWAGKSSENNDLLTTRHTAKNDLWFHARGAGGSHVVLKIGTGKGDVSKQAIDQAASIAAFYSKLKNSRLVPVTMCEGKFVRKPKGVPSGTVHVEREETIFAEPRLPEA
jgi:predicted ribosome quality control (RQC) complex YloA/Tae2 family protein